MYLNTPRKDISIRPIDRYTKTSQKTKNKFLMKLMRKWCDLGEKCFITRKDRRQAIYAKMREITTKIMEYLQEMDYTHADPEEIKRNKARQVTVHYNPDFVDRQAALYRQAQKNWKQLCKEKRRNDKGSSPDND